MATEEGASQDESGGTRTSSTSEVYHWGSQIGSGTFARVRLLTREGDGQKFVAKQLRGTSNSRSTISREVELLKRLRHPNIVYFIKCSRDRKGRVVVVQEYANEGTLEQRIREWQKGTNSFSESVVAEAFAQICYALEYIHENSIVHRDIKPQNVFLFSGHVYKLGDFGLSRELVKGHAARKCGTLNYMAPEVVTGAGYDTSSDLWSLGCVLYEMLVHQKAFDGHSSSIVLKVTAAEYEPISPDRASPQMRQCVAELLSLPPSERPPCSQLLSRSVFRSAFERYKSSIAELSQSRGKREPPDTIPAASEMDRILRRSSLSDDALNHLESD